MIINDLKIEKFGNIENLELNDFSAGINFIYGENESGKTSIRNFLNFMYFGRVGKRFSNYENIKGYLSIVKNNKNYKFNRNENNIEIFNENGDKIDYSPNVYFLNSIDINTFENIFSLTLEELEKLNINSENINNLIFSAGTGLGNLNLNNVVQKIQKQNDNLIRPYGNTQEIPLKIQDINNLDSEIKEMNKKLESYDLIVKYIHKKNETFLDNKKNIDILKNNLKKYEFAEDTFEYNSKIKELEKEENKLKYADTFPSNGKERYDSIKTQKENKKSLLNELINDKNNLIETQENLKIDNDLIDNQEIIEKLNKEKESYLEKKIELSNKNDRIINLKAELDEKLSIIGPEWTEEKLNKTVITADARNIANRTSERLKTLSSEIISLENTIKIEKEKLPEYNNKIENITQQIENIPEKSRNIEQIKNTKSSIFKLQKTFEKINIKVNQKDDIQNNIEELSREIDLKTEKEKNLHSFYSEKSFFIISLLMLLGGISGFFYFDIIYPLILTTISVIMLITNSNTKKSLNKQKNEIKKEIDDKNAKIDKLYQKIKDINRELEDLGQEKIEIIEQGELPATITEDQLDLFRQKAEEQNEFYEKFQNLLDLKKYYTDEKEYSQNQIEKLSEEKDNYLKEKNEKEREWKNWIEEKNYEKNYTPDTFETFISIISSAKNIFRSYNQIKTEKEKILETLNDFENALNSLKNILNKNITEENVEMIYQKMKRSIENSSKKEELNKEIKKIDEKIKIKQEEIEELNKKIDSLFKAAQVNNEDEYFKMYEAKEKLNLIIEEKEKNQISMNSFLNSYQEKEEVLKILKEKDIKTIEQNITDLKENIESLENQQSEIMKKIGELKNEKSNIESIETYSETIQKRENLITEIKELTKVWAKNVITINNLNKTIDFYKKNRQKIFKNASKYIEKITSNKYSLRYNEDNEIILLNKDNYLDSQKWSDGTLDQVYLATRLAFIQEYNQKSENLPIILDDILVKFDVNRKRKTIETLIEYSKDHQLFVFSCDKNTKNLFEELVQNQDNNYKYFELN
ncbi:MAG: AAA family ATPase [Thermotogota bacterium]